MTTSVAFSGASWTSLSTGTYATVASEQTSWTISYWVGADMTAWNTWSNAVQALGVSSDITQATNTARFSDYVLSLKMVGPVNAGDGIIMASTGATAARGAVAVAVNGAGNGLDTHRYTQTEWATAVSQTQSQIIAAFGSPEGNTGFQSFYTAQTASPWTATAWQPNWDMTAEEPTWSAKGVAGSVGNAVVGIIGISVSTTLSYDGYPRFGTEETQTMGSLKSGKADKLDMRSWMVLGAVDLTLAAAAAGVVAMLNF